jgi:hypothetical protein
VITTTECHPDPMRVLDGPKPDSPAGIVYRAAEQLHQAAHEAALCTTLSAQADGLIDPEQAHEIADAWGHLADDMGDYGGHFHPVPIGWTVVDEFGRDRNDWAATVRAALKYLRESAPAVNV